MEGRMTQADAVRTGIEPVRQFMIAQILNTGHGAYLEELADYARDQEGRGKSSSTSKKTPAEPASTSSTENLPLHVVAPAFLLSELTTALLIGFAVYLPFLIVDLVVATILAAMGLWMMPPSLVSTPAKLILFVLADGWMLTAGALMNGFSVS
jgi:flagellar biosynthetic protein FliP